LNMLYATSMQAIGGEHCVWRIYHSWYPWGNASYYGKPASVFEPDYPYTSGADSVGVDDNVSSAFGPFPGIVPDGPDGYYPEANCSGNGVTPPKGAASRHRAYRDWSFCCQGPDATGNVACPWQVNETGIYYISAFAALAGQYMSPRTPPGPVMLTAYNHP